MKAPVLSYSALLNEVQPRVIRDEEDHHRALAEIDRLMKAHAAKPDLAYAEMIELLALLVSRYEDETVPSP